MGEFTALAAATLALRQTQPAGNRFTGLDGVTGSETGGRSGRLLLQITKVHSRQFVVHIQLQTKTWRRTEWEP